MTDDLIKRLRKDNNPSEYGDLIDEAADRIEELTKQRDELLADVERCYKMLLSEPDTKGALFKAENILREAIASVKGQT